MDSADFFDRESEQIVEMDFTEGEGMGGLVFQGSNELSAVTETLNQDPHVLGTPLEHGEQELDVTADERRRLDTDEPPGLGTVLVANVADVAHLHEELAEVRIHSPGSVARTGARRLGGKLGVAGSQ